MEGESWAGGEGKEGKGLLNAPRQPLPLRCTFLTKLYSAETMFPTDTVSKTKLNVPNFFPCPIDKGDSQKTNPARQFQAELTPTRHT